MTIGLVVDSNAQLPSELIDRFDVEVVPITVNVNDTDYAEGVDLDADAFYEFFADGVAPTVVTSQPSPGAFAAAYQRHIDRGVKAILSVHVGSAFSGTVNSARIGAASVAAPVRIVDTETMSFGIACCLWSAAEAIADGADLEQAAVVAEGVAGRVRSTFIVQALEFGAAGGRWQGRIPETSDGITVMNSGPGDHFEVVGAGHSVDQLCDLMAEQMTCGGAPMRAALCIADAAVAPFWAGLEARLADRPDIVEIVKYRVGPSVGAHTGPGTAGGFWYPIEG